MRDIVAKRHGANLRKKSLLPVRDGRDDGQQDDCVKARRQLTQMQRHARLDRRASGVSGAVAASTSAGFS
jgi:hypothetical protein